jgi:hypothetical protein
MTEKEGFSVTFHLAAARLQQAMAAKPTDAIHPQTTLHRPKAP